MLEVDDGDDDEQAGRELEREWERVDWGEAAGRRSGRDSQPRFADAKVEQTQTAISRETTIN